MTTPTTPGWKPPKPATGNYGKVVSAAAHARNTARAAAQPSLGSTGAVGAGPGRARQGRADGTFSKNHTPDAHVTSTSIPDSRTGSRASGADIRSLTSPEVRSSAGISKSTSTEPSRGPGVGNLKNPGVHTTGSDNDNDQGGGSDGPSWKPSKAGVTGNYGAAVSAAAKARTPTSAGS